MISNQILQNTIEGLKGITKIDFCVMDTEGKVLAGTFAEQVLYLEDRNLSQHINIFSVSISQKDIFQLMLIINLKKLISLYNLTVRR